MVRKLLPYVRARARVCVCVCVCVCVHARARFSVLSEISKKFNSVVQKRMDELTEL